MDPTCGFRGVLEQVIIKVQCQGRFLLSCVRTGTAWLERDSKILFIEGEKFKEVDLPLNKIPLTEADWSLREV